MTAAPYVVKTEEFQLHELMGAPNIQIDGISQVLVGSPLMKVVFHQTMAPALNTGDVEIRKACLVLTLTTGDALNFAHTIINNIVGAREYLDRTGKDLDERFKTMLKNTIVQPPPP